MRLNLSPSVSWGLIPPGLILALRERRLLVACGAAAGRVWGGVVVGRVSILLVKLTDTLTIPPVCKICQKSLLRWIRIKSVGCDFLWTKKYCILNLLMCCDYC